MDRKDEKSPAEELQQIPYNADTGEGEEAKKESLSRDEKAELERMKEEKLLREKIARDIEELEYLFPGIDLESIPEQVWQRVQEGESLAGSFSIYMIRRMKKQESADAANKRNTQSAPPDIKGEKGASDYYSRDAVRNMNEDQVRRNYHAIIKSMENWK